MKYVYVALFFLFACSSGESVDSESVASTEQLVCGPPYCTPGSIRYCGDVNNYGIQQCGSDGLWGPCAFQLDFYTPCNPGSTRSCVVDFGHGRYGGSQTCSNYGLWMQCSCVSGHQ